ncbi:hypothetical protein ACF0H5_011245 [Mactra antiquata]
MEVGEGTPGLEPCNSGVPESSQDVSVAKPKQSKRAAKRVRAKQSNRAAPKATVEIALEIVAMDESTG